MTRLTRRQWFRLMAVLGAVVLLLFANDVWGWGVLPQVATELSAWSVVLAVTTLWVTRPTPSGVTAPSGAVRPGFERTFQRRRWTTAAVAAAGLLLWANAQFGWGFFGSAAGILAAAGMTGLCQVAEAQVDAGQQRGVPACAAAVRPPLGRR